MNKYNNTYHISIKIKAIDVKPNIYIDFNKENNNRGPKFKVGYNVGISKYFCKRLCSWSAEDFMINIYY